MFYFIENDCRYFQDVLNSPKLEQNCTEIQLHKDGSWSVHLKELVQEEILNESTTNVEVIPDDNGSHFSFHSICYRKICNRLILL